MAHFMDGVPLWGGNLLFATKFPQIHGTNFISLVRMKD